MNKSLVFCFVLSAASVVSAATSGEWTALGGDELTTTVENWDGNEVPSGIGLTFGAAGTRALLAETLSATGVTFAPAAAARTFTISNADSAPTARLEIGADGITVQASSGENVISSPILFTGSAATLGGTSGTGTDVLKLTGPISSSATVALTASGANKLYLTGTSDFTGTFTSTRGTRYVSAGALGAAGNTATFKQTDGVSTVYFNGGTFDQNIRLERNTGNDVSAYFVADTNHVVNGTFTAVNNQGCNVFVKRNAKVTFNKGLNTDYYDYQLGLFMETGASVTVTNKPLGAYCNNGFLLYAYGASQLNLCCSNTLTRLSAPFHICGNIKVNTRVPWAFSTNVNGNVVYVPLAFKKEGSGVDGATLDLCGNDQAVGYLSTAGNFSYDPSETGKITSTAPATLYVYQTSDKTFKPTFQGAANLWKGGANTLTFSGDNTTTGRLTVAEGTVAFSGSGTWSKVSEVFVTGGTLTIDAVTRLNPKADLYLSGGALEIATGVTLTVNRLFVSDGAGGCRQLSGASTYTAADLPAYLTGGGSLYVKKPSGMALMIR